MDQTNFTRSVKTALQENPEPLIGIAAISLAFRSRRAPSGFLIQGSDKTVSRSAVIASKDMSCVAYFNSLHSIKQHIQALPLSINDNIAWSEFARYLNEICTALLQGQPAQISSPGIESILFETKTFANGVSTDPIFKSAWNKASQQ